MKLYGYFRSSAAFRVRIALNLKGMTYEQASIHLRKGQQTAPEFLKLNPQGLVPALEDGANVLTQSLAIIGYLEDIKPEPSLFPKDPVERARVRALALAIACDIHPLNNLRVLVYLKKELKVSDAQHDAWYRHWIHEGFRGLEDMLQDSATGRFCHGNTPGFADTCLVPQVFNAKRFCTDAELTASYPTIMRICGECMKVPAFIAAEPDQQPDKE
jgi:maleylacetoacetate isomerase